MLPDQFWKMGWDTNWKGLYYYDPIRAGIIPNVGMLFDARDPLGTFGKIIPTLNASLPKIWELSGRQQHANQSNAARQFKWSAINGYPCFNVTDFGWYDTDNSLSYVQNISGITYFIVYTPKAFVNTNPRMIFFSTGSSGSNVRFSMKTDTSPGSYVSIGQFRRQDVGSLQTVTESATILTTRKIVTITIDTTTNTSKIYINGVLSTTVTPFGGTGNIDNTPSILASIFGRSGVNAEGGNGYVHQMGCYNRLLNNNELTLLTAVLKKSWEL